MMFVHPMAKAFVIGHKGCTINELQGKTNVKLSFAHEKENESGETPLTMRGTVKDVDCAQGLILAMVSIE